MSIGKRCEFCHTSVSRLQSTNRCCCRCIEALIQEKLRQYRCTMEEIVELEHASEKVSENLRKIDDHVSHAEGPTDKVRNEIARARQLFVEQLEFLDKEK